MSLQQGQFEAQHGLPALPYLITVPENAGQNGEKLPLIVFLHGAGERGTDPKALYNVISVPSLLRDDPEYKGVRAITLSPQCPPNLVWNHLVLAVRELIDWAVANYPVDEDRISITGLSMGGFGTWDMACTYPNLFSAAAPICGGGLTWRAGLLKNLPIRAFHGDADTCVPLCNSEAMVEAVNLCGGHAELTIFPGVDHNSWTPAYCDTDVIPWLASQTRKK